MQTCWLQKPLAELPCGANRRPTGRCGCTLSSCTCILIVAFPGPGSCVLGQATAGSHASCQWFPSGHQHLLPSVLHSPLMLQGLPLFGIPDVGKPPAVPILSMALGSGLQAPALSLDSRSPTVLSSASFSTPLSGTRVGNLRDLFTSCRAILARHDFAWGH